MEPIQILNYTVCVFVLTTVIYVFLENRGNINLPTLRQDLEKDSKYRLLTSLGISTLLIVILILMKK
jgi:hypothetical protein